MADDDNTQSVLTPVTILDRAVTSGATPEIIEKLMGLQERWEAHQAKNAFVAALARAKGKFAEIIKDNPVQQTSASGRPGAKYSFADLPAICRAVDSLRDEGLYFRWRTESRDDRWITVTCILSHSQGHSEECALTAPPDTTGSKNAVQSAGSTVTYLQRYTLMAALGLSADVDDDGRGGSSDTQEQLLTANQVKELQALAIKTLNEQELTRFWARWGSPEQIAARDHSRVMNQLAAAQKAKQQKPKEEPNGSK